MRICYITLKGEIKVLGGIQRYAEEVISRIKDICDVDVVRVKPKLKHMRAITEVPLKVLMKKCDVYHATIPTLALTLPLIKRRNTIVTFHDITPFFAYRYKFFKPHVRLLGKFYVKLFWKDIIAERSKAIIVPSSQTKEDLVNIFGIDEDKIFVIPHGVSDKFRDLGLDRKYITFCANFSKRKRVDIAVKVYKELLKIMDNPPKLVLAGGSFKSVHQGFFNVRELIRGIEDHVIVLPSLGDEELIKLYNQSIVYLFPSDYESFGFPIIEAARCGTIPIVREEAKITREVKEVALVAKTDEIPYIIYELLNDKRKWEKIRKKCYEKSLKFRWEDSVRKHLEVYELVAKR